MPEIVHDERPAPVLDGTFKTGRAALTMVRCARSTQVYSDGLGRNPDVAGGVQRNAARPQRSFTDYTGRTAATAIRTKAVDR